jgi:hypothetical protein
MNSTNIWRKFTTKKSDSDIACTISTCRDLNEQKRQSAAANGNSDASDDDVIEKSTSTQVGKLLLPGVVCYAR